MLSTYDRLGLPPQIGIGFVIVSFIVLLWPYFAGLDFTKIKFPPITITHKKLFKILGPLLLAVSLFAFYPLWDHPSIPATSAKWAHHTPIENIESLSKSFAVRTSPPPVLKLRFEAKEWPVAFTFQVSSALPVADLKEAILAHFGFDEHVSFDMSSFPIYGHWVHYWELTVNGRIIKTRDDAFEQRLPTTLAAAGVRNSDILQLKLGWGADWFMAKTVPARNDRDIKKLVFPPDLDY